MIRFSYLWRHEARAGTEEGRKDRPCVIVLTVEEVDGRTAVTVAPITHRPPDDPALAIEIPKRVKARLGLDSERSWIITEEGNRFFWPGADLRQLPDGGFAYGELPGDLFRALRERMLALIRVGRVRVTKRTE